MTGGEQKAAALSWEKGGCEGARTAHGAARQGRTMAQAGGGLVGSQCWERMRARSIGCGSSRPWVSGRDVRRKPLLCCTAGSAALSRGRQLASRMQPPLALAASAGRHAALLGAGLALGAPQLAALPALRAVHVLAGGA